MRIAAISDIHGNLPAVEAVLADIARRGADLIVCLGDSISGPLWPRETAELLMALDLPSIAGNHERQLLASDLETMSRSDRFARESLSEAQLEWIADLPPTLEVAGDVFLCHGTPSSDLDYLLETVTPTGRRPALAPEVEARLGDVRASLVLCGHSHTPRLMPLVSGQLAANPGSVGLQGFRWDRPFPHTVATGTPSARYGLFHLADGAWSGEIIAVDYSISEAVQRAASNGAHDWASVLRTGQV